MRHTIRHLAFVLLAAALGANLVGCTVYRAEVRQGNYFDLAKFQQVKPGMTREQVEFLLGPPMVVDGFRDDRWDYVYTISASLTKHQMVRKHAIVWFDGDKVREVKIID